MQIDIKELVAMEQLTVGQQSAGRREEPAAMPNSIDPPVTPEYQLGQIATILARGVARHMQSVRTDESLLSKNPPKSSEESLEVTESSRLSVSRRPGI